MHNKFGIAISALLVVATSTLIPSASAAKKTFDLCDPDAYYLGSTVGFGEHFAPEDYTVYEILVDGGLIIDEGDGIQAHLLYQGVNSDSGNHDYSVVGVLGALCRALEENPIVGP